MTGGKGCISLVPLPKIDELYARLQEYKIFSTLDLRSGYYHIGLSESAKPKTAFVISGIGKYQFNRVPFGLAQAPAYFQTLINKVLDNIDFAMGYLDDIIIFSRSEEEHLDHIDKIFSTDKGSVCNLHVSKETKFLPRFSQDHSEKRPPSTKEILGEKHHERKGKQLGSGT